ncbi:hypothetical protein [Arthrobacter sp. G119Y2]|uniref:hypothetical protein n=1 Tax=Arthrobacter sp. G119Y2 TaxID=3134965 RepID=UPI003119D2BD
MSGASGSGEEFQTGRTNRAEGRTILWAQVPPGQPNFNGPAILIVEVAKDPNDPDDYEDGGSFIPSNSFDGIVGKGWSGGSASNFGGTPGGTGVIGRGGRNQGTGVFGLGGGTPEPGNGGAGGIGVHGLGGPQADYFADYSTPPGAGLVGQGGRQSELDNRLRLPHAAGVIGIGGGTGHNKDLLPAHQLSDTGGVGVYGQGAGLSVAMVPPQDEAGTVPGPNVASGPRAAGAGVLGRGGESTEPRERSASGVVGLAGGVPIPSSNQTLGFGVVGHGPVGVHGRGLAGPGVEGTSAGDRGGTFQSDHAAQVQLVPGFSRGTFPPPTTVTPTALPTGREGVVQLPKDGRGGDLMVLSDEERSCTLWFCVEGVNSGPAKWAQVLTGPVFDGVA